MKPSFLTWRDLLSECYCHDCSFPRTAIRFLNSWKGLLMSLKMPVLSVLSAPKIWLESLYSGIVISFGSFLFLFRFNCFSRSIHLSLYMSIYRSNYQSIYLSIYFILLLHCLSWDGVAPRCYCFSFRKLRVRANSASYGRVLAKGPGKPTLGPVYFRIEFLSSSTITVLSNSLVESHKISYSLFLRMDVS